MNSSKIILSFSFCFLLTFSVFAQQKNKDYSGFNRFGLQTQFLDFQANDLQSLKFDSLSSPLFGIGFNQYISNSFDLGYAFSAGNLREFQLENDVIQESFIYKFHVDLRYKFNNGYLLKQNFFLAPYAFTGYGLNNFKKVQDGITEQFRIDTYNLGAGFNIRAGKNISLQIQSSYNKNFDDKIATHFQHSLGLFFNIGKEHKDEKTPLELSGPAIVKENSVLNSKHKMDLEPIVEEKESTNPLDKPVVKSFANEQNSNKKESENKNFTLNKFRHYIIVGAFQNTNSAELLQKKLDKIYGNVKIIESENGIKRVGIFAGTDETTAQTRLAFHRKNFKKDVWLLSEEELAEKQEKKTLDKAFEAIEAFQNQPIDETETNQNDEPEPLKADLEEQNSKYPKGYYVVVASFQKWNYAIRLQNKLSSLSENIFLLETENNNYRIAYFIGTDENLANKRLKNIRQNYMPDAWRLVL